MCVLSHGKVQTARQLLTIPDVGFQEAAWWMLGLESCMD